MPQKRATEFTVKIDGMTLTPQQRTRFNTAIQKAALGELAQLGVRNRFGLKFPPALELRSLCAALAWTPPQMPGPPDRAVGT